MTIKIQLYPIMKILKLIQFFSNMQLNVPAYLVINCKYNCGFEVPGGFDRSLDEMSKKTVKQVVLSRPHIFHDDVLPSPMIVSATEGPFCKA